MKRPDETVSADDLREKVDSIVGQAQELGHPSLKSALNGVASLFGALLVTYFYGKRKGKQKILRKFHKEEE